MKAWHIHDGENEMQEIVFANTRGAAITLSEAISWVPYTAVRATRAKYADDLENSPTKLVKAQIKHGWHFECHEGCGAKICEEDEYLVFNGDVYCSECRWKLME